MTDQLDLGNIVAKSTAAPGPVPVAPRKASPALVQKCAEAVRAADEARDAETKAKALKDELLLAMRAEGITEIPMLDRTPVKIDSGKECRAPSRGILEAHLTPEQVKQVWDATEKPYERLSIPKPEAPNK